MKAYPCDHNLSNWRNIARMLLDHGISPSEVLWQPADEPVLPGLVELAADESASVPRSKPKSIRPRTFAVPGRFLNLAEWVILHRDPKRCALLYRVLWRIVHGQRNLLDVIVDDDVLALMRMAKSVRNDVHRMEAFVRFRKVTRDGVDHYIAWHRPDHVIVRKAAPFFAQRFAAMHWSILTPDESAHWDTQRLRFAPGVPRSQAPGADELESMWTTYYASIFNPARLNPKAMRMHLPVRHWATLPEAQIIPDLIRDAPKRVETMMAKQTATDCEFTGSARDFIPQKLELPVLRKAAETCRGCSLYCNATQVVFGEGLENASVMFVGEQPGDQEDLAGRPFVGPAGRVLDDALVEADINRAEVFVTNAVKHFKFEQRGKRRIHAKPSAREMAACRPWLEAEIAATRPKLIVCLGATAAQSLMGPQFRITKQRGIVFTDTEWAPAVIATNHPSAILRMPDEESRRHAYSNFVADLKLVKKEMDKITRAQANASAARKRESLHPGQSSKAPATTDPDEDPTAAQPRASRRKTTS